MKAKKQPYKVGTFVILTNGKEAHIESVEADGDETGYHGTYKDGAAVYFYGSNVHAECPTTDPAAMVGGS